jgi:hypothetical protein
MTLQDWVAIGALVSGVLALPAARAAVLSSRNSDREDEFRAQFATLRRDQPQLTQLLLDGAPEPWRLPDFPMLGKPGWVPDAPFDLDEVSMKWEDTTETDVEASRSAAKVIRSLRLGRVTDYSSALTKIAGLTDLFDGKIYRLLDAALSSNNRSLAFTESSYFAYLDTSEVLAFEAALRASARKRIDGRNTHRRRLVDPFDFRNRVASLGIDTLTIRADRDSAGFFLHHRDPKRVVNNSGLIGVTPSGEFTPSDVSSEAVANDFDLWKNIMREYAEELLGAEDAQGQGGRWIDYAAESPYRELNEARAAGLLTVKVLGLGVDPLPWKPELLTVCVIDAVAFDVIFAKMVKQNDEGLIITGKGREGLPFDAATIRRYCDDKNISPNARACLELSWKSRAELGLSHTNS